MNEDIQGGRKKRKKKHSTIFIVRYFLWPFSLPHFYKPRLPTNLLLKNENKRLNNRINHFDPLVIQQCQMSTQPNLVIFQATILFDKNTKYIYVCTLFIILGSSFHTCDIIRITKWFFEPQSCNVCSLLIVLNTRIIIRAQLPIFPHKTKWICPNVRNAMKMNSEQSEHWNAFLLLLLFASFISAWINYVVVEIQIFMFFFVVFFILCSMFNPS